MHQNSELGVSSSGGRRQARACQGYL